VDKFVRIVTFPPLIPAVNKVDNHILAKEIKALSASFAVETK